MSKKNFKDGDEYRMELKDLTGEHELSGVDYSVEYDCTRVLFCLDGVTYVAEEDPDDGYRSYMRELEISEKRCNNTFPPQPVFCEWTDSDTAYGDDDDVLYVKDKENGMTVLKIGTCNTRDYYPWCEMEYNPENMSCNQHYQK